METTHGQGRKAGGLRFDLIPPDSLAELAFLYTQGAFKYDDRNWEDGYEWHKSIRALISHLLFFMAGEDRDPETGALHIIQVAWHAFALAAFTLRGIGKDDRHKDPRLLDALHDARNREIGNVKQYDPDEDRFGGDE